MTGARRDAFLAAGAMGFAGAYWMLAADIPESLLSDAVGAAAFPKMLAVALALVGALLLLRSMRSIAEIGETVDWPAHGYAAVIIVILVAYVAVMPWLGYWATVSLLLGVVAVYAGARGWPTIVATSLGGGLLLWVMFDKVLGIAMPPPALFTGG